MLNFNSYLKMKCFTLWGPALCHQVTMHSVTVWLHYTVTMWVLQVCKHTYWISVSFYVGWQWLIAIKDREVEEDATKTLHLHVLGFTVRLVSPPPSLSLFLSPPLSHLSSCLVTLPLSVKHSTRRSRCCEGANTESRESAVNQRRTEKYRDQRKQDKSKT